MTGFFPPPPIEQPIVITHDVGGYVSDYENAVYNYNRQGRRVEIRGNCRSACTLSLAVKNVCVGEFATVAWHQAYEADTHKLRPEVTERMLAVLPVRLKNYLEGKVQASYTPETTLHYGDLVALGIPDCDSPSYQAPTVTAKVDYGNTPPMEARSAPEPQLSPEEQKQDDWDKYWEWAAYQSGSQFGKINVKKVKFQNGVNSTTLYYWDKRGMYVSVIEYSKNGSVTERKVCRAPEVVADEMSCTDWLTEKTIKMEYDLFTNRYEKVTG